jgi:tRNA (guanine-N7-)-methyltransferase
MIVDKPLSNNETPSLFIKLTSIVNRINIANQFAYLKPVEIELGAGDGSFIVQYAKLRTEHNFIAVERLLGRARKVEKKATRAGLENLRVIRIEAGYFIKYLLPERSISNIHIYFPDPWPKVRHSKNRLIQPDFLKDLSKILKPGGEIYLRTDSPAYFEQMINVFGQFNAFQNIETPQELKQIKTDFEQEFISQGLQIFYTAYKFIPSK